MRTETEGDQSVKARLFGQDHTDGVLKQVIKARLLRDLRQPTGGEDTDEQSGLGTEPGRDSLPSEPVRIGRFAILRQLGHGGMGVVYAAFDEQLDRKVAIKLLRRELTDDERGRVRMLREAQALARLSHPNVVQVHEVGNWRDHDYVAMEFIAGQTLDHWLHERPSHEPRPWREGLSLLIQAGRGLAAAHARDLIHRDFKPANVMVGDDSRVRVLDFGLARSVHERGEPSQPVGDLEQTIDQTGTGTNTSATWNPTASSAFDRELTATGAVLGTPAYMSPEQHLGRPASVLSDQFSFCVVLYEALFGERPFAAKTRAEYAHRVIDGRVEVPSNKSVPVWLRKAVLRGLSPNPDDRWPSMDALLVELTRERGRVWRIGALAAGFAAVLAMGLMLGPSEAEMCAIDESALAGIWDDGRRAEVREAFAGSGLAEADRTLERVEQRLDDQAAQLIAARGDACHDRWVAQEQTDAQLELRNGCIDQRQSELDATVATFVDGDPRTLEHALELLEGLGDVGLCEQVDLLEHGWPVPKDRETAEQVELLRERMARANALRLAGDVSGAKRIVDTVSTRIEALDYGPLSAELLHLRGRIAESSGEGKEAREHLVAAAALAEEFQHFELAATAWLGAMGLREVHGDPEQSTEYRMAQAALKRLKVGRADPRWATLANSLALQLIDGGKSERAVGVLDRSIADLEARDDDTTADRQRVWNLNSRGVALESLNQFDAAERSYRAAFDLAVVQFGIESVAAADADFNLGTLLLNRETRLEEGVERVQRARETYLREHGPQSNRTTMADLALASHALVMGDFDEAASVAERVLTALPPGHEDRSVALDAYAVIQMNRGDLHAAELALDEAIQTHVDEGRSQHDELAFMFTQRGELHVKQGRFADALEDFDRASAIYERSLDERHPDWVHVLVGVGNARLGLGEPHAAWEAFERAQTLIHPDESDRRLMAHVAWGCARALRALQERPEDARRCAESARSLLLEAEPQDPMLNEIEAFQPRAVD